jgi:hypothetical protein
MASLSQGHVQRGDGRRGIQKRAPGLADTRPSIQIEMATRYSQPCPVRTPVASVVQTRLTRWMGRRHSCLKSG